MIFHIIISIRNCDFSKIKWQFLHHDPLVPFVSAVFSTFSASCNRKSTHKSVIFCINSGFWQTTTYSFLIWILIKSFSGFIDGWGNFEEISVNFQDFSHLVGRSYRFCRRRPEKRYPPWPTPQSNLQRVNFFHPNFPFPNFFKKMKQNFEWNFDGLHSVFLDLSVRVVYSSIPKLQKIRIILFFDIIFAKLYFSTNLVVESTFLLVSLSTKIWDE